MLNNVKKTIEWADFTANPFTGCLHGCDYCYARKMAHRMGGIAGNQYNAQKQFCGDPFRPCFSMAQWDKLTGELHKQKKPRRIFLGSMSDIGGDWTWDCILNNGERTTFKRDSVQNLVKIMAEAVPRHTFLILTKNPEGLIGEWPDNCHIGVSADNNKDAESRTEELCMTVSAGINWVSLEPLLEPVSTGSLCEELDWIVIGGQTGPGAPTVPIENVKEIVGFARLKGISCFVKKNIRDKHPGEWPMEFPA